MINLAICDDEGSICDLMEDFIKVYESSIMEKFKVDSFLSGEELYQSFLDNNYYDIIFLK